MNQNINTVYKKHIGKCALCGKKTELTFEHIPPRSAFNSSPAKPVTLETILKSERHYPRQKQLLPYTNQQKGLGLFSLCKSCNENTGSWYGDAYYHFAKNSMEVISSDIDDGFNCVEFYNMYPLRIIKQIISMFCSVNVNTKLDDLREFVLNKESIGIDKNRYKICMYFTKSTTCRHSGMTGLLDIKTSNVTLLSEIVYRPLGLLLYLNADDSIKTEGIDRIISIKIQ